MTVVVFSWSGSFRDDLEERREDIAAFIDAVHDRGFDVVMVAAGDEADAADLPDGVDDVVGHVEDLRVVLTSLAEKHDKVFFVSDVRAELATATNSGAFTVGLVSDANDAHDLSGAGPNYVVASLDELDRILDLEDLV